MSGEHIEELIARTKQMEEAIEKIAARQAARKDHSEKTPAQNFGNIFRFITPLLIIYVAWTGNKYFEYNGSQVQNIRADIKSFMKTQSETDKRVDRLEWKVFGVKNDGNFNGG